MTFGHVGLKLRLLGRDDMLEFFRVATLPMRDLVDEHFESESLKAALCWDGMVGSKMAPRSPNQAVLTLLNRMAGVHGGQHVVPAGGMGAFVAALESRRGPPAWSCAPGSPVARVCIDGDENGQRCSGVRTGWRHCSSGPRAWCPAPIPKTTFLKLVGAPRLEIEFSNRIRRLRCDGYVAKLHLALGTLPAFPGVDRPDGRMILAADMDSHRVRLRQRQARRAAGEPVMEVLIPSLRQSRAGTGGQHVLSANVMYVPHGLKGGWNRGQKAELQARLMEVLERHAPGIGALVGQ
jgi:phytoene dehydrogenase-like protein